jgi:hypothetical protein
MRKLKSIFIFLATTGIALWIQLLIVDSAFSSMGRSAAIFLVLIVPISIAIGLKLTSLLNTK